MPRPVAAEVAESLARTIHNFTSAPTWDTLRALVAFPKIVLGAPPKARLWSAHTLEGIRQRAADYTPQGVLPPPSYKTRRTDQLIRRGVWAACLE